MEKENQWSGKPTVKMFYVFLWISFHKIYQIDFERKEKRVKNYLKEICANLFIKFEDVFKSIGIDDNISFFTYNQRMIKDIIGKDDVHFEINKEKKFKLVISYHIVGVESRGYVCVPKKVDPVHVFLSDSTPQKNDNDKRILLPSMQEENNKRLKKENAHIYQFWVLLLSSLVHLKFVSALNTKMKLQTISSIFYEDFPLFVKLGIKDSHHFHDLFSQRLSDLLSPYKDGKDGKDDFFVQRINMDRYSVELELIDDVDNLDDLVSEQKNETNNLKKENTKLKNTIYNLKEENTKLKNTICNLEEKTKNIENKLREEERKEEELEKKIKENVEKIRTFSHSLNLVGNNEEKSDLFSFVDENLNKNFICGVCKKVMSDPQQCVECRRDCCKRCCKNENFCPFQCDLEEMDPNSGFNRRISNLLIKCNVDGKEMKFSEYEKHSEEHIFECKWKCGFKENKENFVLLHESQCAIFLEHIKKEKEKYFESLPNTFQQLLQIIKKK